jgi:hypothetical protein
MLSRKLLLDALAHRQPARVPVDFGSTVCTGLHVSCVDALRDFYGLEKRPVKVIEPGQMLGEIDEDLKQVIGTDVEMVPAARTMFGFANEDWKEWQMDSGLVVLVPRQFATTVDTDGSHLIHPQGDLSAPPSGRMPRDGFYFDAVVRQEPLDEDALDPADNLEEFSAISEQDLRHYAVAAAAARATGRGVVAAFGGSSLGNIALIPGPGLKQPRGIRDITEWYISTITRQDYLHAIFAQQTDLAIENLAKISAAVGSAVDVAYVCGTDFGTQTNTFCSRETFCELYLPYYRKVNDWIHAHTPWKTMKHCCGAIEPFLSLFIEAGFDIINPVQCSAAGMDPQTLKARYGDRLTFWGGGVDTQQVLPFGTPQDVRAQVLERCRIFSAGGGFVFNSVHNVQAGTPVENIVAMFDAVKEFNG